MAELELSREQRLHLKAQAHHLNPVVLLGAQGLSDAVMKEIDRALTAHGLIKVRAPGDDRDERERMFEQMSETLGAARVNIIGKVLVLFRPIPEQEQQAVPAARSAKAPAAVPKSSTAAVPRGRAKSTADRGEVRRSRPSAPRRGGGGGR
jgi:RNA-binding protein